jgi:hypothetical protein
LASAAHGRTIWNALRDTTVAVTLRILDGHDPAEVERFATVMLQSMVDVQLDAARHNVGDV